MLLRRTSGRSTFFSRTSGLTNWTTRPGGDVALELLPLLNASTALRGRYATVCPAIFDPGKAPHPSLPQGPHAAHRH
jgi:hypothetical protein